MGRECTDPTPFLQDAARRPNPRLRSVERARLLGEGVEEGEEEDRKRQFC